MVRRFRSINVIMVDNRLWWTHTNWSTRAHSVCEFCLSANTAALFIIRISLFFRFSSQHKPNIIASITDSSGIETSSVCSSMSSSCGSNCTGCGRQHIIASDCVCANNLIKKCVRDDRINRRICDVPSIEIAQLFSVLKWCMKQQTLPTEPTTVMLSLSYPYRLLGASDANQWRWPVAHAIERENTHMECLNTDRSSNNIAGIPIVSIVHDANSRDKTLHRSSYEYNNNISSEIDQVKCDGDDEYDNNTKHNAVDDCGDDNNNSTKKYNINKHSHNDYNNNDNNANNTDRNQYDATEDETISLTTNRSVNSFRHTSKGLFIYTFTTVFRVRLSLIHINRDTSQ